MDDELLTAIEPWLAYLASRLVRRAPPEAPTTSDDRGMGWIHLRGIDKGEATTRAPRLSGALGESLRHETALLEAMELLARVAPRLRCWRRVARERLRVRDPDDIVRFAIHAPERWAITSTTTPDSVPYEPIRGLLDRYPRDPAARSRAFRGLWETTLRVPNSDAVEDTGTRIPVRVVYTRPFDLLPSDFARGLVHLATLAQDATERSPFALDSLVVHRSFATWASLPLYAEILARGVHVVTFDVHASLEPFRAYPSVDVSALYRLLQCAGPGTDCRQEPRGIEDLELRHTGGLEAMMTAIRDSRSLRRLALHSLLLWDGGSQRRAWAVRWLALGLLSRHAQHRIEELEIVNTRLTVDHVEAMESIVRATNPYALLLATGALGPSTPSTGDVLNSSCTIRGPPSSQSIELSRMHCSKITRQPVTVVTSEDESESDGDDLDLGWREDPLPPQVTKIKVKLPSALGDLRLPVLYMTKNKASDECEHLNVLFPGIGPCQIRRDAIMNIDPSPPLTAHEGPREMRRLCVRIARVDGNETTLARFLACFPDTIESLRLQGFGDLVIGDQLLEAIGETFPRLHCLELESVHLSSLDILVRAYTAGKCRVRVLHLMATTVHDLSSVGRFFAALSGSHTTIAVAMEDLKLSPFRHPHYQDHEKESRQVIVASHEMLVVNQFMRRFTLVVDNKKLFDEYEQNFKGLQEARARSIAEIPVLCRVAFLSVMQSPAPSKRARLHTAHRRALPALDEVTTARIFDFARSNIERTISYEQSATCTRRCLTG